MQSHSQDNVADFTEEGDGKRPKNRAPPPPPAKSKSKPPRGFSHQVSQPLAGACSEASTEVGSENVRFPKPPPGHKRTKSDQPMFHGDRHQQQQPQAHKQQKQQQQQQQQQQQKQQQTQQHTKQTPPPPLKQQQQQQQKGSRGGAMHPNQYSPLSVHRSGRATPPLGRGRKSPVLPKASERTAAVGKSSGKAESGGGGSGSNRSPLAAVRKRHSTVEQDEEGRVREREPHHVRICITWDIVHVL